MHPAPNVLIEIETDTAVFLLVFASAVSIGQRRKKPGII
jgi:hypothetical protein